MNTDTCPRQEHDQDRTVSIDMNRTRTLKRVHGHGHGHITADTNTDTFHEHDQGHAYGNRFGSMNKDTDVDKATFPRTRTDLSPMSSWCSKMWK